MFEKHGYFPNYFGVERKERGRPVKIMEREKDCVCVREREGGRGEGEGKQREREK